VNKTSDRPTLNHVIRGDWSEVRIWVSDDGVAYVEFAEPGKEFRFEELKPGKQLLLQRNMDK
jgi:hypothetical protein